MGAIGIALVLIDNVTWGRTGAGTGGILGRGGGFLVSVGGGLVGGRTRCRLVTRADAFVGGKLAAFGLELSSKGFGCDETSAFLLSRSILTKVDLLNVSVYTNFGTTFYI